VRTKGPRDADCDAEEFPPGQTLHSDYDGNQDDCCRGQRRHHGPNVVRSPTDPKKE
jgi:hypothetical protein